jgi:hypothetical protein
MKTSSNPMNIMNADPPQVLANVGPGSVAGQLQLMLWFCNKKRKMLNIEWMNKIRTHVLIAISHGYTKRKMKRENYFHFNEDARNFKSLAYLF